MTFAVAFLLRRTEMTHAYWLIALAFAFAMLMPARSVSATRAVPWWLLYVAIGVVSIMWTDDRGSTLPAVITTLATFVIVFYCRHRATSEEVLLGIVLGTFVDVSISLAFSVLRHAAAYTPGNDYTPGDSGGLRGLFTHKNWLALAAGVLLVIILSKRAHLRSVFGVVAAAVAVTALILANSKGGLIAVAVALGALAIQHRIQRGLSRSARRFLYVCGTIIAVPVAYNLWSHALDIADALNKQKSVGRRLQLWQLAIHYGSQKPISGWGLRGAWNYRVGVTERIAQDIGHGFTPFGAHNGYVDTFLGIGVIGFVALLMMLVTAIRTHLLEADPRSDTWLGVVLMAAVFAFSDSFLTVQIGLILIVLAYSYGPRSKKEPEAAPAIIPAPLGEVRVRAREEQAEFDGMRVHLNWPETKHRAAPP